MGVYKMWDVKKSSLYQINITFSYTMYCSILLFFLGFRIRYNETLKMKIRNVHFFVCLTVLYDFHLKKEPII